MILKFPIFPRNSEPLKAAIDEREELQKQELALLRKFNGKPAPDAPDSVSVVVEPE